MNEPPGIPATQIASITPTARSSPFTTWRVEARTKTSGGRVKITAFPVFLFKTTAAAPNPFSSSPPTPHSNLPAKMRSVLQSAVPCVAGWGLINGEAMVMEFGKFLYGQQDTRREGWWWWCWGCPSCIKGLNGVGVVGGGWWWKGAGESTGARISRSARQALCISQQRFSPPSLHPSPSLQLHF